MTKKWMTIAGALLWLSAGPGWAQEAAPLQLNLHDAVNLALKQNPRVILANLEVAQSAEEVRAARSGLLPRIDGTVGESVNRENVQALFGGPIPGFPGHIGPFEVFQIGAGFQAPVFDLTLWRRYRASQAGANTARADEITAREESVLLVVSQYLGSQRAAADVAAAESRVKLAQALYDQAADLQKNGVGTGIDTLRANVELQNEKQRSIVARTGLDTSLFGLARLLSVDPKRKIELADQGNFFQTPGTDADQTLEHAYSSRPELQRVASDRRRLELGRQAASEERLPKVSANGSWGELGLAPDSVIPQYQFFFALNVPIFTGGRIQAERAKADLALRQLAQQEQDLHDRIALEVKTAVAQMAAARNEVDVANQGIELARQEVDQARDRFQAGVANNIEVISAQDALARANDNQIAALYRFNQARADVAHAAGQMETLYAK